VPLLDIDDAVAELRHAAELGLHLVSLPTGVPEGVDDWHYDTWEPLWAAAEDTGMVLCFHIGSDGTAEGPTVFRGPGGAVLNYVETTYGGQKVATKLVASGALDRHADLRVLISEGGATWVPFLGDRMNEGYRQHGMFVRPTLSMLPKELLYRQVYASFQHDESAPAALTAMGYPNVMWGSDYPHLEGTYGHTQKTLHELFDNLDPAASERIRFGAFKELFPHVSDPPAQS
jgi:predicted TIM-barrel fold metal-dependent hydrolase